MKNSNASIFRRYFRAESTLLRGSMPKTAVADPAPPADRRVVVTVSNRGSSRLVRVAPALTFSLGSVEVVRG